MIAWKILVAVAWFCALLLLVPVLLLALAAYGCYLLVRLLVSRQP